MDNTYSRDAWQHLGKELERRRGQFGYGFRQRGDFLRARGGTMSEKMLGRLERGEREGYPDATTAALEALYGWAPGSFERVLDGGEAVLTPGTPGGPVVEEEPDLSPADAERLGREIFRIVQGDRPDDRVPQAILDIVRAANRRGPRRRKSNGTHGALHSAPVAD